MGDETQNSETEVLRNNIPREFKISDPMPSISPQYLPPLDSFPSDIFRTFNRIVYGLIPEHRLDSNVQISPALAAIKETFDSETTYPLVEEMIMRQFLITCQSHLIRLMPTPSLTKFSILHHELYLASEILHARQIRMELEDYCDMMMADTVDLYHNHFSDIVEQKFWSKTKTVEELIRVFLKKEFERLRILNPYTFKMITTVSMRKCIDSAPNSAVSTLIQWGRENSILID